MKATRIKMKSNYNQNGGLLEIDQIYIEDCNIPGFYYKSDVYDYLEKKPRSIYVDISPYPYCIPAISSSGEKYVKSSPDNTIYDNLLNLPRE
ncbi:MAG: DUF3892 domain-containing protein [Proteocatella sp.]